MTARTRAIPLLLLAAACGRAETDDSFDPVRLTMTRNISIAPLVIAEAEGYFEAEKIRLEHTEAPTRGMQSIPLLDRGDIDVLASSLSIGVFAAVAAGSKMRLVADRGHVYDGCEFNAVVGRGSLFTTDSPTTAEVRGRTLSINPNGTAEFIVDRFLAARGLSPRDVRLVRLSEVAELQAVASGAVDLMHASEPYLTRLKEAGTRVVGPASALAPGAHFGVIIYGPRMLEDRDVGLRFMTAYLRGVRQFGEGPTPRNVQILSERLGFEPALLRKACFAGVYPDGKLDLEWLMEFQRWGVAKGYMPRTLELDDVVDLSFTRSAAERLDSAGALN